MIAYVLIAWVGAASLSATAALAADPRASRPDWVSGDSSEWPRARYVVGVGIADDQAAAEQRARAEVARTFSARVSSQVAVEHSEAQGGREGGVQRRSSAVDRVRVATDGTFVGVEIVATWEDLVSRRFYALAVLDRERAAERLQARLDSLRADAAREEAALSGPSRIDAMLSALRVQGLFRAQEAILAEMTVLVSGSRIRTLDRRLAGAANDVLRSTRVKVTLRGDGYEVVRQGINRALAAGGLGESAEDLSDPDLRVDGDLALRQLGEREGWHWAEATLTLTATWRDGRVLVHVSEAARGSATRGAEAPRRAVVALAERVGKSFSEALVRPVVGP